MLGFVGFVREWHGLDAVIAAMAAERDGPRLRLVVVGDGPARPALEQQAAALGLADRVTFTGLQPREAIPGLVAGFDIALQPLVVSYASPLKIFEYMAAGRAIVAPDQPNIREVLRDGETAVLFDPSEAGAMWRAIQRLAGDAALRRRMGDAARDEIARRDYTWRGNAARVVAWAGGEAGADLPKPADDRRFAPAACTIMAGLYIRHGLDRGGRSNTSAGRTLGGLGYRSLVVGNDAAHLRTA